MQRKNKTRVSLFSLQIVWERIWNQIFVKKIEQSQPYLFQNYAFFVTVNLNKIVYLSSKQQD